MASTPAFGSQEAAPSPLILCLPRSPCFPLRALRPQGPSQTPSSVLHIPSVWAGRISPERKPGLPSRHFPPEIISPWTHNRQPPAGLWRPLSPPSSHAPCTARGTERTTVLSLSLQWLPAALGRKSRSVAQSHGRCRARIFPSRSVSLSSPPLLPGCGRKGPLPVLT